MRCRVRSCVSPFHDGFDDALLPEDALERFFVLELPDGELVVDRYVEPASRRDEVILQLDALLETVQLARWSDRASRGVGCRSPPQ